MSFLEYMPEYFTGEKAIGYFGVPVGLLALAFALSIWRVYWVNPMARGLFVPVLLVGVLATGLGGVMYTKSQGDIERLTASFGQQAQQTLETEKVRMAKVNANWPRLKAAWAVLLLIGMGGVFFLNHDTWEGVALGLILMGAMGFLIDHTAERRGLIYAERLDASLGELPR